MPPSFPRRYTVAFLFVTAGLLVGGMALWWPDRSGPSTAQSDLGLALVGGGLAITAGFLVARVVFGAERRLDETVRESEQRRERESLKFALSIAESLVGADLHGRDLTGLRLFGKNLDGANLETAILARAEFMSLRLLDANLRNADLRNTCFRNCDLSGATLEGADLRGAIVEGDWSRSPDFRNADLRGTDLSAVRDIRTRLDDAKYDDTTRWPEGMDMDDPQLLGAVYVGRQ